MLMAGWGRYRAAVLGGNLIYLCALSCGSGSVGNLGIKDLGKGVDSPCNRADFRNTDVGWNIILEREFERPSSCAGVILPLDEVITVKMVGKFVATRQLA